MKWTPEERAHLELLERWRTAMNLVGPGPAEDHFIDAAGAVDGLAAEGQWADLGSGAGFPGVALAARHPGAQVTLVESRQKRALFLGQVIRAAGLTNVTIFHGRTENLEPGFDGVISRAYRPPLEYLQDADRLLRADGVAVLLTGDEMAPVEGWVQRESHRYPATDGFRTRTVLARA